jgi:hypothetical protein
MSYAIIQVPFALKLRDMSKEELGRYFQWFMDLLPQRVTILTNAVRQTRGFETWHPDLTPSSLDMLGEWFAGQVETRSRTKVEIQAIESHLFFPMEIPGEELTNRTFSLAMDIGIYFSQVLLKNYPFLKWEQPLGSKKFIDYGQPVLVGFGPGPFNPVRMVVTFTYGLVSKKKTGEGLRNIYKIWTKQIRPAS